MTYIHEASTLLHEANIAKNKTDFQRAVQFKVKNSKNKSCIEP